MNRTELEHLLGELAHFLPEQAPLHTFVHHNTLHAFEHLPFDDAVLAARAMYGAEPYQTEAAFAAHLGSGRTTTHDLDAALDEDLATSGDAVVLPGLSRRALRRARLHHPFETPGSMPITWALAEADLLVRPHPLVDANRHLELQRLADERFASLPASERMRALLGALWRQLARAVTTHTPASTAPRPRRRRDELIAAGGVDIDQRVLPLTIRLVAAFLDQGIALWPMPSRDRGLLAAVRLLLGQPLAIPDLWQHGLAGELRRQERAGLDAAATITLALDRLEVAEADRRDYLLATLLTLPGWAGMVRQFESRPDRAPVRPVPARLVDYVAVLTTFDSFAARHELAQLAGREATFEALATTRERHGAATHPLCFESFVVAQLVGVDPQQLAEPGPARAFVDEVAAFDDLARRRLHHRAFERRLRTTTLDALLAHQSPSPPTPPAPTFQAVFCIDDRECSTRRHLEEIHPAVETFGFAGFFGVAMAWQGLGEVRSRPLCPVNVVPQHYVTERALDPAEEQSFLATRRRRGLVGHSLGNASRELARGGLVTTVLGVLSIGAVVGRCLFPGLAERTRRAVRRHRNEPPTTRLVFERRTAAAGADERTPDGLLTGYSVPEMTQVVFLALTTMRLTSSFCEIVLLIGHGSSSLNNPHGSAYDCGATGGGRGGPNARVFAAMANHPGVRAQLAGRGITIPATTWFVGAFHDTCDDSMTWFDEDLMPDERLPALEKVRQIMARACALDAHERCRRFVSAPRTAEPEAALRHAQARSMDLAQPRPECGHATNAFAIVGRRSRTRGLFLDRRAFLISYDPTTDADGAILARLLGAVVPVGAGINLEYYFSYVDRNRYGCGTKLPHNITGLVGVMDGHSSDLRTGLPWQMVEIHEPVRLLTVIEAEPETITRIATQDAAVGQLVRNGWVQVVAWSPSTGRMHEFVDGTFRPYDPRSHSLGSVLHSAEHYQGHIDHLPPTRTVTSFGAAAHGCEVRA